MMILKMIIKIGICLIVVLLLSGRVQARMCKVRTPDQFYHCLNERSLAVVLFYKDHRRIVMPQELRAKFCAQMGTFDRMSRMRWYIDGDLVFVAVNLAFDCLQSVAQSYNVEKVPTYLIFKHGRVVRDAYGNTSKLSGFVTRDVLEAFIDRYLRYDIQHNNKEAANDRALAAEEARLRYMYYAPYMYWGWPGWPYCGSYPGGYSGCGWGGYGWGGGYGRGGGCCGGVGIGCCIGF